MSSVPRAGSSGNDHPRLLFVATHQIKAGYGYWDATNYPIGGKFCRVSKTISLDVETAEGPMKTSHGYLCGFRTEDGRSVWANEAAFCLVEGGAS